MATTDELRARAELITEEQQIGGNTAGRVGSTFEMVAELLDDATALANQEAQYAHQQGDYAKGQGEAAQIAAENATNAAVLANQKAQYAEQKGSYAEGMGDYSQQQGGYAKDQGDYAKDQGDYAKAQGDTALADHQRAEADHGIAVDDHTQAGNDHTRAESDHGIAVDDHTQAGNDHARAESDHGIAVDDHMQAGNDHARAESDHTRAESDHAAVEVYVDSLGAFDISVYHATGGVLAKYADLTAALGTNGANIPDALRKGGMSVKFVQSSDNKYVQYFLTKNTWSAVVDDWERVDLDYEINAINSRLLFAETCFGKYDTVREITLSQNKSGKYVNTDGSETTATGYGISNSVELNFGDILLVPSAEAVPASVSVVARVVTRTYQKVINYAYTYQQENPALYNTATADYDQTIVYTAVYDTSGETPVLTGWAKGGITYEELPATHEVSESYYEPLVKQAVSAMPSTGYYVYLCPSAMTIVISGLTATVNGGVCKVVGWGIFKNIVSNFVGAPGQAILAQLLCDLDARMNGVMSRLENLGEVKVITVDSENLPKVCGQSMVVSGAGAPAVVPQFVGQRYHDTTNKKVYEAFAVTASTSDWTLLS